MEAFGQFYDKENIKVRNLDKDSFLFFYELWKKLSLCLKTTANRSVLFTFELPV